jgi:SAM-dependent methyltransferase
MARLAPATAESIANAAGLDARYVREWLAALTCGGIVEYSPGPATYRLPPAHAASLTTAAGKDNLAFFMQMVAAIASVEDRVVESFANGRGVPYSAFSRFLALQSEESSLLFDGALATKILPLAPSAIASLERGADVLDVGCGRGHAINVLAQLFPHSRFVGWDFSEAAIAAGGAEALARGLDNVRHVVADAAKLASPASYDLILAFDAIHDLADPATVLVNCRRALRPGGTFLCVDVAASSELADNLDHPFGPGLYTVSMMHCMSVSRAQGGAGLGSMWGRQKALSMLREAGFLDAVFHGLEGDPFHGVYVGRSGAAPMP